LPAVAERCPDVLYLIVGRGDDRSRLESLAAETVVSDRVRFAGEVAADELPDVYNLANVFAMPSTCEGFGIAFLEALASGVPVIGGKRDGSVDPLADGALGRIIDPDDREELVSALVAALSSEPIVDLVVAERFAFAKFTRHVHLLVQTFV
jgi:phosphatidyl-myo-inositol dimannoside synthase